MTADDPLIKALLALGRDVTRIEAANTALLRLVMMLAEKQGLNADSISQAFQATRDEEYEKALIRLSQEQKYIAGLLDDRPLTD